MKHKILTSPAGTNYVTFGDNERMYELLESSDPANTYVHDFELRVEDSPEDSFVEFRVEIDRDITIMQVFGKGFEQAKLEIAAQINDFENDKLSVLNHLQHHLTELSKEFPYENK